MTQSTGNLNGYPRRQQSYSQLPAQSMPNLQQINGTQQNSTRAASQQTLAQAPQGRMARAAQVDEEFRPDYHSTEFPENYEG